MPSFIKIHFEVVVHVYLLVLREYESCNKLAFVVNITVQITRTLRQNVAHLKSIAANIKTLHSSKLPSQLIIAL